MLEAVRIYPSSSSLRAITVPSDSSRKISLRFLNSLSFGSRSPLSPIYTSHQISRFGKRHLFLRQEGSLQEFDDSPVSIELEPISSETMFDRVITEAQMPNDAVVIVWKICERSGLAAVETKYFSRYLKKGKRHYGQHGPLSVWPHLIQCGQWSVIFEKDVLFGFSTTVICLVLEANWCRKCIYLKPQLEKLAAEYYPGLRFYHVDVNTVSYKLVARAGVTKMPTIQLWMNGEKRAEVIGGHKPYLVINEVRQMIEDECIELI